ncbi:MAG TPA: low affinity iron permease family protein [Blastocatellia bacterium]|nr:low affinity iron permease family protein [Blastocatellia bacterium]
MSKKKKSDGISGLLEDFSYKVTVWSGSSWAFLIALGTIVVWAITGPIFGFSDTWQLVINTGTTIVTFLMVFLIQRAQNKESLALQVKLNEIIAALGGADNRLINIEDLSEEDVEQLHKRYQNLGRLLKSRANSRGSHSNGEKLNTRTAKKEI